MKEMLEIARLRGWRAALEERLKELDPEAYSYARDETRANWTCLLPPGDGAERVLYAGRDFGSVAAQLAACYGTVVHLVGTVEEAEFLLLRMGEEPRQKLLAVVGSVLNPPFGRGVFDMAIIDGLEELCVGRACESSLQESLGLAIDSVIRSAKSRGLLVVNSGRKLTAMAMLRRMVRFAAEGAGLLLRKLPGVRGEHVARWSMGAADFMAGRGLEVLASYAAVPHFKDNLYLLPADCHPALKYALKDLGAARRHLATRKMRVALRVANFFLRLNLAGLILRLIPASVTLAQKGSGDDN